MRFLFVLLAMLMLMATPFFAVIATANISHTSKVPTLGQAPTASGVADAPIVVDWSESTLFYSASTRNHPLKFPQVE